MVRALLLDLQGRVGGEHELGHCLGLGHSVDGPSVMFWTELGGDKFSSTVTAVDVAKVKEMYR